MYSWCRAYHNGISTGRERACFAADQAAQATAYRGLVAVEVPTTGVNW